MTPEAALAGALFLLVLGVGVVVLFWRTASHSTQVQKDRLEQLSREADEWVARVNRGITPISTRLILKNDEHAILEEGSTLFESRAYRVYGGGGTRIGRVYVGGGVSESQQRIKQIDQDTLTLTTKRLIFDGSQENRNVQLSQVLSASPWADAIEISTERRAKSQIYSVENPAHLGGGHQSNRGRRLHGAPNDGQRLSGRAGRQRRDESKRRASGPLGRRGCLPS